jgi:hypothetical protein
MTNGDLFLYDRQVKRTNPDAVIENADDFLDWLVARDPEYKAVRYKNIEAFGNARVDLAAEPTGYSNAYCSVPRGEGGKGDCCNSEEKDKGCQKDTGYRCGM